VADNPKRMNQQTDVRLIVCPRPLSVTRDRIDVPIPAGATVAEHLRAIGFDLDRLSALVYVDDRLIPRAEWESAVPQAGQVLTIQAVPASGGDRGGGKHILAIGAFLGLMMANQFSRSGQSSFPGLNFGILPDMISRMVSGGSAAMMARAGLLPLSPLGGWLAVSALIPTRDFEDMGVNEEVSNG
jgi:sulfur carrier protein ThiS